MKILYPVYMIILTSTLLSCGSQTEQTVVDVDSLDNTSSISTTATEASPIRIGVLFSKTVRYKDFQVIVSSDNIALENKFRIKTIGFRNANLDNDIPVAGKVTDVLIDDIDADDAPEVFVISRPDSGGLATVYGFSANKDLSMSYVSIPHFKGEAKAGDALKDGDEYMPVENTFVVRFPIYENGIKTGKTRQLQYKLKPGEAQKKLVFEKFSDY